MFAESSLFIFCLVNWSMGLRVVFVILIYLLSSIKITTFSLTFCSFFHGVSVILSSLLVNIYFPFTAGFIFNSLSLGVESIAGLVCYQYLNKRQYQAVVVGFCQWWAGNRSSGCRAWWRSLQNKVILQIQIRWLNGCSWCNLQICD